MTVVLAITLAVTLVKNLSNSSNDTCDPPLLVSDGDVVRDPLLDRSASDSQLLSPVQAATERSALMHQENRPITFQACDQITNQLPENIAQLALNAARPTVL